MPFATDRIDFKPGKKSRETSIISKGCYTTEEVFENLETPPVIYEEFKNKAMIGCKVVLERIDFSPKDQRRDTEHIHTTNAVTESLNKRQVSLSHIMASSVILQNAQTSKSASAGLCQFDCLECHESFNSWWSLCSHAEKEHNNHLVKANFENYLYKAVVHVCKICSQRVLCDNTFLTRHTRWKHHLSIGEYRKNYDCHTSQTAAQTKLHELLKKAEISEIKIGNLCLFQCAGCKETYKSSSTFTTHNRNKILCPLKGQTLQWQTSLVKVVAHRCKLCSKLVLCDRLIIMNHVRKTHGIGAIGKYAKQTGSKLQVSVNEQGAENNLVSKNAPTIEKAGNFCTFKCNKCGQVSQQWADMKRHLKRTGHGAWVKLWHKYITKVVTYKCKICNRKVLNDRQFLGSHVNEYHQMTLSNYMIGCKSN